MIKWRKNKKNKLFLIKCLEKWKNKKYKSKMELELINKNLMNL
jgi:hypothetical protein